MSVRSALATVTMPRAVAALALATFVAVLVYVMAPPHAPTARAEAAPTQSVGSGGMSGVEVLGVGKVEGKPDVLRLDLAVSVTRSDAQRSLETMSAAARRVIAALKARGVSDKDIKTANLSLHPEYDYSESGSRLKGYAATQQISVVLRDLKRAGATIGSAVAAGGDAVRVQGVALDLEGDSELLAKARTAAIVDAKNKASAYAEAAGRKLGAVTVISENTSSSGPYAVDGSMFRSASPAADVPIEQGSQQLSVSVRVVWSFA